jgi:SET domain-containing protein
MLLVKTVIKPSSIEGVGVFADEFIAKGTTTWEFDPSFDRIFSKEEFAAFPDYIQKFLQTYAYQSKITGGYVLDSDNGRFTNHSDTPNLGKVPVEGKEAYTVALRDIRKGEELTLDYRVFPEGIDF